MKLVVIESRYQGDVERNVKFAEMACRIAALSGFAPIASHLLYTRFLNDSNPAERRTGIECGLAWASHAEEAWFCLPARNRTFSPGMLTALERHRQQGRTIFHYTIGEDGTVLSVHPDSSAFLPLSDHDLEAAGQIRAEL